jgi:PAS domain S-box-containing protein
LTLQRLYDLISSNEDWLINRVLYHARLHDYTKYTSTLAEAWRLSIQGLSQSLTGAMKENGDPPEFGPDDDFSEDPIASFGILEARRHRSRGVTLGMFLGLMKYYRQSYIDLIEEAGFDSGYKEGCRLFAERAFDRIEIGFNVEWSTFGEDEKMKELQFSNRTITNEKNKYLTIFESTPTPVIFLNRENLIDSMNHAAATLIHADETPGSIYYAGTAAQKPLPWEIGEIAAFAPGNDMEYAFERTLETKKGVRCFQIRLKRMLDVSRKFSGIALILNDITEKKRVEEAMQESEENYRSLFQNASIGIFHSLPEGRFLRVNPALAQMMGYGSPEEMVSTVTDIGAQIYIDSKEHSEIFSATLENTGWVYAENRYRRKDGAAITANLAVRKVLRPDGTIAYMEGFVEDISERRRAEEERERLVLELRGALSQVKALSGLLPICSSCKKIKNDKGYWEQVEDYIRDHSQADFSHGICPECAQKLYPEFYKKK